MNKFPTNSQVVVRINEQTEVGEFHDSLYYTPDEWSRLTQVQLDSQIATRVSNWVSKIQAKKSEPIREITEADLISRKEQLEMEIEEINNKLS